MRKCFPPIVLQEWEQLYNFHKIIFLNNIIAWHNPWSVWVFRFHIKINWSRSFSQSHINIPRSYDRKCAHIVENEIVREILKLYSIICRLQSPDVSTFFAGIVAQNYNRVLLFVMIVTMFRRIFEEWYIIISFATFVVIKQPSLCKRNI